MATLLLKSSRNEQRAVIRFLWAKGRNASEIRSEMHQCMATSVLRDQPYTFGVRSSLVAEKTLLISHDMAGMLLRRVMPRLPQLMLSYGPTGACHFQMFE